MPPNEVIRDKTTSLLVIPVYQYNTKGGGIFMKLVGLKKLAHRLIHAQLLEISDAEVMIYGLGFTQRSGIA